MIQSFYIRILLFEFESVNCWRHSKFIVCWYVGRTPCCNVLPYGSNAVLQWRFVGSWLALLKLGVANQRFCRPSLTAFLNQRPRSPSQDHGPSRHHIIVLFELTEASEISTSYSLHLRPVRCYTFLRSVYQVHGYHFSAPVSLCCIWLHLISYSICILRSYSLEECRVNLVRSWHEGLLKRQFVRAP